MVHRVELPLTRAVRWAFLAVLLTGVGVGCSVGDQQVDPAERAAMGTLAAVGRRLDSFQLADLEGRPVRVSFPGPGPTALIVLHEADCLSCVNLAYESWQVARWMSERGGRIVGVVVAESLAVVRAYVRHRKLPFALLVDSTGWTERTLGLWAHPLIAFTSADGVIVTVMLRTPALTETQPITRYLATLDAWLSAPHRAVAIGSP